MLFVYNIIRFLNLELIISSVKFKILHLFYVGLTDRKICAQLLFVYYQLYGYVGRRGTY